MAALAGVRIESADADPVEASAELRAELGDDDASVASTASRVSAAGTSLSARCVVTEATRSGSSDAPPTSSMTTWGDRVRCAKNSVCPEKGMPASSARFSGRGGHQRGKRAGEQASDARQQREYAVGVGGIGLSRGDRRCPGGARLDAAIGRRVGRRS